MSRLTGRTSALPQTLCVKLHWFAFCFSTKPCRARSRRRSWRRRRIMAATLSVGGNPRTTTQAAARRSTVASPCFSSERMKSRIARYDLFSNSSFGCEGRSPQAKGRQVNMMTTFRERSFARRRWPCPTASAQGVDHRTVGERGPRSGADFRSSSGAARVRKGSADPLPTPTAGERRDPLKTVRKTAFHQPVIFRTRPSAGA